MPWPREMILSAIQVEYGRVKQRSWSVDDRAVPIKVRRDAIVTLYIILGDILWTNDHLQDALSKRAYEWKLIYHITRKIHELD